MAAILQREELHCAEEDYMSPNDSVNTEISPFALLQIAGADSERLLQGQLTCDVSKLNDQHWTLGACCTAKGRMVANFVIARRGNEFLLRLPTEQAAALQAHLGKYAVFYKVNLQISDWQLSGAWPETAGAAWSANWQEDGVQLCWPDGRTEIWGRALPAGITLDNPRWQLADIEMGLVWVREATREHWIPQHVHWDILGGVNFRKGCYTGQEVVARVQYLGKSKRQLALVHCETPPDTPPVLLSPVMLGEKSVGEVASWCQDRGLVVLTQETGNQAISINGMDMTLASLKTEAEPG
jgi:tRNA-modifying protein YgfZ